MRRGLFLARILAGTLLALVVPQASAVITCSVSVTSLFIAYDPTNATQNATTGSYTISCNRAGGDANTQAWRMGVDNGTHFGGGSNRVQRVAESLYSYETYRPDGSLWGNTNPTRITGTLNFGANLTASMGGTFDIRMPALQTVQAAGLYTDTLTVTLQNSTGSTTFGTTTFGVNVHTDAWCQITASIGDVVFTYTSFQGGAASATGGGFTVRCTPGQTYTFGLQAGVGAATPPGSAAIGPITDDFLNLAYTLGLSACPVSGSGCASNGAAQAYNVTGTMAAGQSGTCNVGTCANAAATNKTHTLIVNY